MTEHRCRVCGKPATQLAHRIPQTKQNVKHYGERVIHHPYNLAWVCGLACNDAVSISNHPVDRARLLARIYDELGDTERRAT